MTPHQSPIPYRHSSSPDVDDPMYVEIEGDSNSSGLNMLT